MLAPFFHVALKRRRGAFDTAPRPDEKTDRSIEILMGFRRRDVTPLFCNSTTPSAKK
ncbi:hypothetical protein D9M72_645980 [compost metagenome]